MHTSSPRPSHPDSRLRTPASHSLGAWIVTLLALLLFAAVAVAQPVRAGATEGADATTGYVMFAINVQDFSYPEMSIATVRRILDIHDAYQVPVDVYLTTTMVDVFAADAPDILERLATSEIASASYHVRPPSPYYTDYDWAGLGALPRSEQEAAVVAYETHGLDLVTGEPTDAPGGYAGLAGRVGYAPYVVGDQSDGALAPAVDSAFRQLGARFLVQHGRATNLGDSRNGLRLRPEHFDLLLFQHVGEKPKKLLKSALAEAQAAEGAIAPYFIGIKMHDNDFFAEDSAWVTNYLMGPRRPPFDPTRKSPLLSEADQAAVWATYEKMVRFVGRKRAAYAPVNAPMVWEMVGGDPGTATATLCISATMHIESNRQSWPDPDALVAFFERATVAGRTGGQATGLRWSVGADIGWLEGEPRAAEVIRRTEALGVTWDVHAHEMADRADVAAAIAGAGGHPNDVASGLVVTEIDGLRGPLASASGTTWQAGVLWGIVRQPNHGTDSDDFSVGVWRPRSAADWTVHDPAGSLIAVGRGPIDLDGLERLAERISANPEGYPPVLSATLMVSPRQLLVVDSADGIDAIEAWASRVGALRGVRWATIRETADAWVASGSVPSRLEDWENPARRR